MYMAPRARGEAPFSIGRLWKGIEALLRGLVLTFLRWFRPSRAFCGFVFAFWLFAVSAFSRRRLLVSRLCWAFFCAAVSFLCLVIRARHKSITLLNCLCLKERADVAQSVKLAPLNYRV